MFASDVLNTCTEIRRRAHSCERCNSTQLPFAYVHLLSVVVVLNNVVLSIVAGLYTASCIKKGMSIVSGECLCVFVCGWLGVRVRVGVGVHVSVEMARGILRVAFKPQRYAAPTASTSDCLQWALSEGIGERLRLTDPQNRKSVGKFLYCILFAIWLSAKAAVLKNHVARNDAKQADDSQVWFGFSLGTGLSTSWSTRTTSMHVCDSKHAAVVPNPPSRR